MHMSALPQFLCDLLAAPPRHGEGVHHWIYKVARQLHAHRDEADICALLAAVLADCGRIVSAKEISEAVSKSKANAWQPNEKAYTPPPAPRWPKCNKEQREGVLVEMDGYGLPDLWEASPQRCEGGRMTNQLLADMFPSDCLLCAGMTNATATTKPLAQWLAQDMSAYQFIVPSPMTALTGMNQQGNESPRCLANTGPRRFLVIEADEGTKDEQAAILDWLAQRVPLTLVLSSGGKSLHGWFNVTGASEAKQEHFFRLACQLGADLATWTRCQLVRMPDGTRAADPDKAIRALQQAIYFYNPDTLSK